MNKNRWFIAPAFTIAYAAVFSIGLACLWNLFLIALASGMFSEPVFKDYPRFVAFCYIVGMLALGGLLLLFILDGKTFIRRICWSKFGAIIGLSIPLFVLWNALLRYLQAIY